VALNDAVFGAEVNRTSSTRSSGCRWREAQGTHDTKSAAKSAARQEALAPERTEARAGTTLPLWRRRHGLRAHPPDHSFTVPKKAQLALISALSMKVKREAPGAEGFPLAEVKTKKFKEVLTSSGSEDPRRDRPRKRGPREVLPEPPRCENDAMRGINVYDLLKYDSLVLLEP